MLEFMGVLKDENGGFRPASSLDATKYLPSLHNVVWEKSARITDVPIDDQTALAPDQKLMIRRCRLAVEILKRPSDNKTKYDLFQRLNAGGTPANAQELRNCIIIMANAEYFQRLKQLAENQDFRVVAGFNDEQIEKQKLLEWICRFMVHVFVPYDGKLDVEEYIDSGVLQLTEQGMTTEAEQAFTTTFSLLNSAFGVEALRRFQNGAHRGKVGLAAFEVIAIGLGKNIRGVLARTDPEVFVRKRVLAFWRSSELESFFSLGMRGTTRIQRTVPFGQRWFA